MKRFYCFVLVTALAMQSAQAAEFPFGLKSYQGVSEDRVDYALAHFNTEVEPCLQLVRTDWKAEKPAAIATPLCTFQAEGKTLSVKEGGVQGVDYWDLSWNDMVASFVIEYDADALVYYQCRLPVNAPTPAITCTRTEATSETWEAAPHKNM